MTKKDFLFEIGCEELPPKLLAQYAAQLLSLIAEGIIKAGLIFGTDYKWFATPRRLAVLIKELDTQQPTQSIERRGPAVNLAYDQQGQPSKAALGFAVSCGVEFSALSTIKTDKGEWLCYQAEKTGEATINLLPAIVAEAIKKLPIAKTMRWADSDIEFIRPVHWIVMLFGDVVVPATILGVPSGPLTYGHRFLAPHAILLNSPAEYEEKLEKAYVIADFETRKELIKNDINQAANNLAGTAVINEDLLSEVTAIVEWPVALVANFDERFLQVPQEALMSAMQQHQKSFPVVDQTQKMLPQFIFISNLASREPQAVITGNEKVMRARLSDAMFFYETDLQTPLAQHLDSLKTVVFQAGLGSLFDRSERIATLAQYIAEQIGADPKAAHRAGVLSKCDLMTTMVGEFPELQGTMGSYYALDSGEHPAVASAIKDQYSIVEDNDRAMESKISKSVMLADKLDTLIGIFGINQKPSGTKDPFGLRRAAIGVSKILRMTPGLDLNALLKKARQAYDSLPNENVIAEVTEYIFERLKFWYIPSKYPVEYFNAVAELNLTDLDDFNKRITTLFVFTDENPQSTDLIAANKRVVNILNKTDFIDKPTVDLNLFVDAAEAQLFDAIQVIESKIALQLSDKRYSEVLKQLIELAVPIEQFFADVMVNVEDTSIKENRIALLWRTRKLLNSVADLSRL
jgi:glycyl-tRNA synthetase beta chain